MKRRLFAALLFMLLLTGCGGKTVPPPPEEPDIPPAEAPEAPPEEPQEPEPPEDPEEAALLALLEDMTLEEKTGQLFFVRCPAENALEDVTTYHLGGYLLFGRDTQDKTANDLIQTIASWQTQAAEYDTGIPLLIGVDEEGGTVVRVSSNPKLRSRKFSSPGKLWKEGLDALLRETREKSILLKSLGFNVNLAPVADVSTNSGDFIYDRTTGMDAEETADYTARVTEAQSFYGLGSVLKHFPGYGNNKDTHTGVAVDERSMETFLEQDFLPFQAGIAVEETVWPSGELRRLRPAVLVSHNIVNCMDPNLPASLSPEVHRILREDLGFDGVVMTDDLAMDAVKAYAAEGNVAVMSIQAGNDLVVTTDYRTQIPRVIQAVRDGALEEEAVDAACLRVLRWKLELGLLERTEEGTLGPAL
ncbi:glycoside hydrolase family 3 protein [uncultured Oscillibacter sp.]|uniref:glycoside hydrolase family 3 protein n=1 Tax=uncultured Oscillibacter sp. TaxID=876091 RepID=UPI0026275C89|nr:glycoside hydrolase family 3 N-terminal domain-containing protein [uncultured Oscillibacter sp.]